MKEMYSGGAKFFKNQTTWYESPLPCSMLDVGLVGGGSGLLKLWAMWHL